MGSESRSTQEPQSALDSSLWDLPSLSEFSKLKEGRPGHPQLHFQFERDPFSETGKLRVSSGHQLSLHPLHNSHGSARKIFVLIKYYGKVHTESYLTSEETPSSYILIGIGCELMTLICLIFIQRTHVGIHLIIREKVKGKLHTVTFYFDTGFQ